MLDPIHTDDSALRETECPISEVRSISGTSSRGVSFHFSFADIIIHDCDVFLRNVFPIVSLILIRSMVHDDT